MTNPNLSNRSTELISKGIAYVNDLLSNSGDRLGYYDFIERYQIKINFVDFYSLTHSLPSHWLKSGKTQQKEGEMKLTFLQSFLQQKQTSKWVYQKLRTLNKYNRGHEIKWAEILGREISESDWSKYYRNNFQSVIETSLRDFQYQILTRSIPTNRFLSKCKLTESDKCFYCKECVETVEHLFWYCPVVKTFWFNLFDVIFVNREISFNLDDAKVLLGGAENENKDVLNYLFTVVKKYIYNTKCKQQQLSIKCCISLIQYYHSLEQCVATNEYGIIKGYVERWELLSPFLEYRATSN